MRYTYVDIHGFHVSGMFSLFLLLRSLDDLSVGFVISAEVMRVPVSNMSLSVSHAIV